MLVISSGGMYMIVVALKEIASEFGWPRAVPSFAFSMQYIGSGFGGIIMGYALDRFGFGMPAVIGAIMVGVGGILVSYVDSAWQLFAIYGFMFGLCGQGGLSAPALANIARWYDRRRGMAVGIVSSGQAAAGILWPPVCGYLLGAWGWREMYFWYGVFALCTMLPLCLAVRHKPPPYVPPASPRRPQDAGAERQSEAPGLSDRAIQRVFCCAIIGCCVAMSLPLAHLVALVTDLGHPVMDAVELLSLTLLAAFLSRAVLLGLLSDRMGGLRALLIFSLVQAATLAALAVVQELWLLYTVAVLYGLGYGGIFPVYAIAVRDHLPVAEAGRRTGIVFLFGAAAMGFGSWMGGYLFDLTGAYTMPFLIGVAFNVVNIAIVVALITRLKAPRAPR
jgi:MFS family permease